MRRDTPEQRRSERFNATAARVTALWGTISVRQIAKRVGSSTEYVSRVARVIGLPAAASPRNPGAASTAPQARPLPPRGFTPEQVLWARMNQGHPEARMILVMHADPAAARRHWPA